MNIERIASLFLLTKGIITTEKAIKVIKELSLINEFKLFYSNILAWLEGRKKWWQKRM